MKALVLLVCLAVTASASRPIVREPGAIYMSDFQRQLPRFKLVAEAPCYFEADMKRYAGTLRFPQVVQLDAISEAGMLRVRGNARQGGVAAWIEPQYVEGLPPNYLETALRAEERRLQIEDLVARSEVAIGMTLDEVARSLGKPQKRTSRASREGTTQEFEYIRYKLIPQTVYTPAYVESMTGYRPRPGERLETVVVRQGVGIGTATVYVKVPIGTVKVGFIDGVAETIEESEGTLAGARVTMVAPPVELVW